jgi:outer membrane protein assembly factor BamB
LRRGNDRINKAVKLPNGDIGCMTDAQQYVRFDKDKKEISTFRLEASTFGGRIDVLPNGHVLAPQLNANKVLEFDTEGKIVWQAAFNQPVAAVRLASGHTLVTSFAQQRAVEVDRDGREVWEYPSNTRITRAWRR